MQQEYLRLFMRPTTSARREATLVLALLLVVSFASSLTAGTTGKVAGKVSDVETGDALPGANVVLEGTTLGAATDANGNYTIVNVPPGLYTVVFSYIGYQTVKVKEVRVNSDFTSTVNMKLKVTAVELGTVEVIGERNPLVREDLTNTTVAVTSEVIQQLPVNTFTEVVRLQSGVTIDNSGAIHIRGGRSNEVAYLVNGVSLANPFDNSLSVGIATNAIEELSVSSGTFSAEYGNALSGVINFVTKDGGPRYSGSARFYTGDNLSSRDDIFPHIDDFDVLNHARSEATLSGPVPFTNGKLTFFTSGVYVDNKGYLYGTRLYAPSDGLDIETNRFDPLGDGKPSGDGAIVPMDRSFSTNLTTKLTYKFSPKFKLTYDLLYDRGRAAGFSRAYRFNPDGRPQTHSTGQSHSIGLTHTVSNMTFYTLKGSYGETSDKAFVYDDPFDPRYVPSNLSNYIPATDILAGGTNLDHSRSDAHTFGARFDLVSQVRHNHELKLGGEVLAHRLEREFFTLVYDTTQARPIVPYPWLNPDYTDYVFYVRRPLQFSAYVLDKMELAKTFILNAGLRYEYYNTYADYNPDLAAHANNPSANLQKGSAKQHLSPRLSLSYPITDRGIIRFSYGHFYQMPTFRSLYQNPRFETFNYTQTPTFGDPNLKPERSIQYEMGLQQQLTEDLKVDLTVFYKDVSDLLVNQQVRAGKIAGDRIFNVVSNLSYANVRGFTFSLLKRRSADGLFSASLDYTFTIAEGNQTDTDAFFLDKVSGKETELVFVPLSFDRSHVLNGTVTLTKPKNWTMSAVGSFWTGTPYTPQLPASLAPVGFEENSARRPILLDVDLRLEKFFKIDRFDFSLFTQVENLFDRNNERFVWSSTGRSLFALEETLNASAFNNLRQRIRANPELYPPESALDDYYKRADWLSDPREIKFGITMFY